jgi:release factor glutamine methyltransferase
VTQPVPISGEALWQWRQQAIEQIVTDVALAEQADYRRELDWLLMSVTSVEPLSLRLETFRRLSQIESTRSLSALSQLWRQRLADRVPVQYLVGSTTWRGMALEVSPAVLIPRPETELIIDLAENWISKHSTLSLQSPMQWADLGTGSGAIAIGLAQSFPQAIIHAVDLSPLALSVARQNAARLVPKAQIHFHLGEWLAPLAGLEHTLTGMISNPPYIPSAQLPTLQPEVYRHEPHLALDGGEAGLTSIAQIVAQSPLYLKKGGLMLLEIMDGQSVEVKAILLADGRYDDIQIHRDLSGIVRFVSAMTL